MSPRAFTDEERTHTRARLRAAAIEQVSSVGFRHTTVAELARVAGISKGSFYAFYPSKEALFVELLLEEEATMRSEVTALAGADGPPEQVLGAILRRVLAAVTEHPLLRVLADPEESAALFRHLPPGAVAEAKIDDDQWFRELFGGLADRGIVARSHVPVLVALPRLLFATASGRRWLPDDLESTLSVVIEALITHLSAPASPTP
ncbi:MAG TPA: TetR/AcrR family transcriptional regulator [Deltaproteobacteria bacterium]|nr:TetR/AcrR family transcriptional regulator [Deltaproteobacteria bacterium]